MKVHIQFFFKGLTKDIRGNNIKLIGVSRSFPFTVLIIIPNSVCKGRSIFSQSLYLLANIEAYMRNKTVFS